MKKCVHAQEGSKTKPQYEVSISIGFVVKRNTREGALYVGHGDGGGGGLISGLTRYSILYNRPQKHTYKPAFALFHFFLSLALGSVTVVLSTSISLEKSTQFESRDVVQVSLLRFSLICLRQKDWEEIINYCRKWLFAWCRFCGSFHFLFILVSLSSSLSLSLYCIYHCKSVIWYRLQSDHHSHWAHFGFLCVLIYTLLHFSLCVVFATQLHDTPNRSMTFIINEVVGRA